MPQIQPIPAVVYAHQPGQDVSAYIAPPYDVLDEASKGRLVAKSPDNVVVVDLPHLPAKTVGPDSAYAFAGQRYREWLERGVLRRLDDPAVFVYQQTYTVGGTRYQRRGLIANVEVQPFGKAPNGRGGIFPHEETFSAAKEDRLKLMRATQAQLSPIFGLYSDPSGTVATLLEATINAAMPDYHGRTEDGVLHEVWIVTDADRIGAFQLSLGDRDIFIADGHHRYNTALNYKRELEAAGKPVAKAAHCLFVLISMQDAGMIVLPTHRVLGGMPGFTFEKFQEAAKGKLRIEPVLGTDLEAFERTVNDYAHPHAIGLYDPSRPDAPLHIATTVDPDPLKATHGDKSEAWRQLDVAIVQHLIVEQICQPTFTGGQPLTWKFPHELSAFKELCHTPGFQLGVLLRPTPLDAVRLVSEAGELMPQKSTFFYPKLATGLVINPLD